MDSTPLLVATQEDLARRTIGVGRRGSAQFDIEPDDDATGGAPGSGSGGGAAAAAGGVAAVWHERGVREWCYALLEPNRPPSMARRRAKASSQLRYKRSRAGQAGLWIERVLIMVIVLASLSYVLSTLDWEELLPPPDGEDAPSNAQQRVEATFEVVEWVAALTFSTEYVGRLCVIGVNDEFRGWRGLLWYAVTPFALLDFVAVVPFWIGVGLGDSANDAVRATQSVRLLRILRFMFLGEWGGAFADMGQAFSKNKAVLVVSGFAGVAVWVIVASLYYLAERDNPQMVWDSNSFCALSGERCGPDDDPPFNVEVGDACPADDEGNPRGACLGEPRFGNILVSMYFTLLNMFGEFPLVDRHSTLGRLIGTFAAVIAVAVFSVPIGILGDGFGDAISSTLEKTSALKQRRKQLEAAFRRADADGSGGISKAELVTCMQSLGYPFSQQEVFEMAELADTDRDGTIDMEEFSRFIDGRFKGEFRTYQEPPQVPPPGASPGARPMIYRMLHPRELAGRYDDVPTRLGKPLEIFIVLLIVLNVLFFVLGTVEAINPVDEDTGQPSGPYNDFARVFEAFSVAIFVVEYLLRLYCVVEERAFHSIARGGECVGRLRWMLTFYALVDVAAVLPFFVDLLVPAQQLPNLTWIRALRLLRLLKINAYVHCFDRYVKIVGQCIPVFQITLVLALVTWVFFSILMHYAEKDSRDPDTREFYVSVPASLWMTLLNLTGEAPLCDYTIPGRIITAIIGLFATAFFAIPIGVLSGAFEKDFGLDDDDDSAIKVHTDADSSRRLTSCGCLPAKCTELLGYADIGHGGGFGTGGGGFGSFSEIASGPQWRQRLNAFVEAETKPGRAWEATIFGLIFVSIVLAVLETVDALTGSAAWGNGLRETFAIAEGFSVMMFTVEYVLRLAVAPEQPAYRGSYGGGVDVGCGTCVARLRFVISFYSLIDLAAIVPWYLAFVSDAVDEVDSQLRLLRILRLLKLDKYYPGITLIDDVVSANALNLGVAAFVACVAWLIFATLLYLTERNNDIRDGGTDLRPGLPMSERWRNIPNSLSYTLILLSGDYPLTKFTPAGKVVNFVMIICAQAVVAIPTAIIVAGFTKQIEMNNERERIALAQERAQSEEQGEADLSLELEDEKLSAKDAAAMEVGSWSTTEHDRWFQQRIHNFLYIEESTLSRVYVGGVSGLIVLNILSVFVESWDEERVNYWGRDQRIPQQAYDVFEACSVAVFTLDYILRLYSAARADSSVAGFSSPLGYALSFFGILDLVTILPFYIEQILSAADISFNAAPFRVFRIFRMFQIDLPGVDVRSATGKLGEALSSSGNTLIAFGLVALIIWLGSSAFFWLFERDNNLMDDEFGNNAFQNIPSAMYYVAVFLVGEWGVVDFGVPLNGPGEDLGGSAASPAGKVLCMLLVVVGIALYAIPISIIFDSFQNVLEEDDSDEEDEQAHIVEGVTAPQE